MNNNPINELKDLLINMKSALQLITEAKVANLETVKKDFSNLVNLATQMELEKELIDKIESVKEDSEAISKITKEVADQMQQYIKAYL